MLHPMSSETEIKQSVISTKSKLLFALNTLDKKIYNIIDETEIKKCILMTPVYSLNIFKKIIYTIRKPFITKKSKNTTIYTKFLLSGLFEKKVPYKRYGYDTPAVILKSGGTSGKQKNVCLQNRCFIYASIQQRIALSKLNDKDKALAIMPNFHGFGLSVCMHTPLSFGAGTVLVPVFEPKRFDKLLNKTKPQVILGVPTLYEALVNNSNIDNLDLSFLKYVISGGDALSSGLEEKVNNYLSKHNSSVFITQGYGLSEALGAVILSFDDRRKERSIGIPLPGNHVKIINPSTRETCKFNETGEIVINNKALMMGYLNDEAETNEALQIHDDGHVWLHTGDLGYMDEDGFIYYQGREKRLIITSGYNVYPSYVESVIETHPDVLQCTVVGVPHPYKQEVGKAFVVLKDNVHNLFIKTELKNYCMKNLSKYMVPASFVIRKKLPKTKMGKVDFKKLQSDIGSDEIDK